MTLDATEIIAGLGEAIYVGPTSEAYPTGLAAPSGNWRHLGYVSEDGVTFASQPQFRDQLAWQSLRPIGKKKTGVEETVTFGLMQFNPHTVSFAFGGITFTDSTTFYSGEPPADTAAPDYRSIIVDWSDGSNDYRLLFRKVLLTGNVEMALQAASDVVIPVELSILQPDSGKAWTLRTNDANFDPTP